MLSNEYYQDLNIGFSLFDEIIIENSIIKHGIYYDYIDKQLHVVLCTLESNKD